MALWGDLIHGGSVESPTEAKKLEGKRFGLGCNGCPADDAEGTRKLIQVENVEGKDGMLWMLAPNAEETRTGEPNTGASREFVHNAMTRAGMDPDDFDFAYAVSCRTTYEDDRGDIRDRNPDAEELHHCSIYARRSRQRSQANVHLIFGRDAAEQVMQGKFDRGAVAQWSDVLNSHVFTFDNPGYLQKGPKWKRDLMRKQLRAASFYMKNPGRYSFLRKGADFEYVSSPRAVREVIAEMRAFLKRNPKETVSIDIEAGWVNGKWVMLCVGLSWKKDHARCIILRHPDNPHLGKVKRAEALMKEILEDKDVHKIFHYGCSDVTEYKEIYGITVRGFKYDTLFGHYLNYTFMQAHGLEAIVDGEYPQYAGYKKIIHPWTKNGGKGKGGANYADIPLKILALYNCADAAITKRLELDTRAIIPAPLMDVYISASFTLKGMEGRGFYLDDQQMELAQKVVAKEAAKTLREIRQMVGKPNFNPNNPKEVGWAIYDWAGLELEGGRKRLDADGNVKRGTDKKILGQMTHETKHPLPGLITKYRKFSKMEGTYLANFQACADRYGDIRSNWNMTGTVTGRLSSSGAKTGKINLQNVHGDLLLKCLLVSDKNWRQFLKTGEFDPEELYVFLANDYGQAEIRFLAQVSGDKVLLRQFAEAELADDPNSPDADIHCIVGNLLNPEWSREFIKNNNEIRTFIKNCHFGMVYGLDEEGLYFYLLAKGVDTTQEKVSEFHRAYFRKYKGVARYILVMRKFAKENGYVENIFGFRRNVDPERDEDRDTDPENQAINSPIQGAAHHMMLTAQALLHKQKKKWWALQTPVAEIHDAFVWRVKLSDLQEAYKQSQELMTQAAPAWLRAAYKNPELLTVPLVSESKVGFRLGVMTLYQGESIEKFRAKWIAKNAEVDAKFLAMAA